MNVFTNFINIDGLDEQCLITVRIGNTIAQQINVPLLFAQQQFMQVIQQISKDTRPMEVKCIRQVFTEEGRQIENSLAF
jgi:hypothetical protein